MVHRLRTVFHGIPDRYLDFGIFVVVELSTWQVDNFSTTICRKKWQKVEKYTIIGTIMTVATTFSSSEIAIIILAAAVLILGVVVFYQNHRFNKILKGKSAKDLEDSFHLIEKEYRAMRNFRDAMSEYLKGVEERVQKSVQGVSVTRFNAWKGTGDGGNQSFASAFLSEKGDGIIISSLHHRDKVSIFAKPVSEGKSSYELSEEEKAALQNAQANIGLKK